jgi:hypothetical protein
MRAFAACLSVVLGLGAFSVVACSSDATTTAAGGGTGEAGAAPSAGSGGKASSGGAPGAAGEAGAPASTCSFDSDACQSCVPMKCPDQVAACGSDSACLGALSGLDGCVCGGTSLATCETNFAKDGGDPAAPLVTCFNDNCKTACE